MNHRHDTAHHPQGPPVWPELAREVALALSRLHPSERRRVLAARRDDVGRERFQVEAAALMQAASEPGWTGSGRGARDRGSGIEVVEPGPPRRR